MMEITETAFMLILHAGNARNNAKEAEAYAGQYDFSRAEACMQNARNDLNEAHKVQTDLIQAEARGEQKPFGLIMVHAQDHLSMAMMAIDHAVSTLNLYRKLNQLEK